MGPTTNVLCQGPGGRTQELFGSEWVYTLQARVACMYRVTLIMVWAEMSFVDWVLRWIVFGWVEIGFVCASQTVENARYKALGINP